MGGRRHAGRSGLWLVGHEPRLGLAFAPFPKPFAPFFSSPSAPRVGRRRWRTAAGMPCDMMRRLPVVHEAIELRDPVLHLLRAGHREPDHAVSWPNAHEKHYGGSRTPLVSSGFRWRNCQNPGLSHVFLAKNGSKNGLSRHFVVSFERLTRPMKSFRPEKFRHPQQVNPGAREGSHGIRNVLVSGCF